MEPELKKVIDEKFLTAASFAMEIEKIVSVEPDMDYIDAIVFFCESNGIEVESVSKIISKPLKEKLKCEAIELNLLKKTSHAKLPL